LSKIKLVFNNAGTYRFIVPNWVSPIVTARIWGAGGQAGFNTSGNAGGSGAAGIYVKTFLNFVEPGQGIYVSVGQGGGRGQRSFFDGRYFSGGWGGYGGHKQAGPSGDGGHGGGASVIAKPNLVLAAAGGGGGGGGASRNYAGGGGNLISGSLYSEPGHGYNGVEMIGFGGGGGGGGGGPQRGGSGNRGDESVGPSTGGKSGGAVLFASGGGIIETPLSSKPYIDNEVTPGPRSKTMGTGGQSNGQPGTDGYVELTFDYGAPATYIKKNGDWKKVIEAYYKSTNTGNWIPARAAYHKQGNNWVIVNSTVEPEFNIENVTTGILTTTGETKETFGRIAERPPQYVDPPPPPPPVSDPGDWHDDGDWGDYDDSFDSGGGGDGGGDSIICTELFRRGMMPADIYAADAQYGSKLFDAFPEMKTGYHRWARIVTEWMNGRGPTFMWWIRDPEERARRQSAWATKWAEELAAPWAAEMAHIQGVRKTSSRAGRWLMRLGYPITKYIGKMKTKPKYMHLVALVAILAIAKLLVLITGEKINLKEKNDDSR